MHVRVSERERVRACLCAHAPLCAWVCTIYVCACMCACVRVCMCVCQFINLTFNKSSNNISSSPPSLPLPLGEEPPHPLLHDHGGGAHAQVLLPLVVTSPTALYDGGYVVLLYLERVFSVEQGFREAYEDFCTGKCFFILVECSD